MATLVAEVKAVLAAAGDPKVSPLPLDRPGFEAKYPVNDEVRRSLQRQGRGEADFSQSLAEPLYGTGSKGVWPRLSASGSEFLSLVENANTEVTNKNDLVFQLMQVLAEQKTVVEGIAEGEPIPETTKTKVGQALLSLAKHLKDIENAISPLRNEDENGLAKTTVRIDQALKQETLQKWRDVMKAVNNRNTEAEWRSGFLQSHFESARQEIRDLVAKCGSDEMRDDFTVENIKTKWEASKRSELPGYGMYNGWLDLDRTRHYGWTWYSHQGFPNPFNQLKYAVNACTAAEATFSEKSVTYPTKTVFEPNSRLAQYDPDLAIQEGVKRYVKDMGGWEFAGPRADGRYNVRTQDALDPDVYRFWQRAVEQLQVAKAICNAIKDLDDALAETRGMQTLDVPLQQSLYLVRQASWAFSEMKSMYLDQLSQTTAGLTNAILETYSNLTSNENDLLSSDLERTLHTSKEFIDACTRIRETKTIPKLDP